MGNALGWPHLLVFLAVILLIFGAAKLPALAKSVGQSARVFKGEMKAMKEDDAPKVTSDAVQPLPTVDATVKSEARPASSTDPTS